MSARIHPFPDAKQRANERALFSYSEKLVYLQAACIDPRLVRTDLAVLGTLLDYANRSTRECFPSIATLVARTGVPRMTVIRAIKRLEQAGWIEASRRAGAATEYRLTDPVDGTSPAGGTGTTWNATGTTRGLRTGTADGTEAVPPTVPEQEKALNRFEQDAVAPDAARPADPIWGGGLQFLMSKGVKEGPARGFLGKLRKQVGDDKAADLLGQAEAQDITDPRAWLTKAAASSSPKRVGAVARDDRCESEIEAENVAELARFGVEVLA